MFKKLLRCLDEILTQVTIAWLPITTNYVRHTRTRQVSLFNYSRVYIIKLISISFFDFLCAGRWVCVRASRNWYLWCLAAVSVACDWNLTTLPLMKGRPFIVVRRYVSHQSYGLFKARNFSFERLGFLFINATQQFVSGKFPGSSCFD